jgi:hypothetical protein
MEDSGMDKETGFEIAGSAEPPPAHSRDAVTVAIIKGKGDAALVQWVEGGALKRGYVPLSLVRDSQVEAEELRDAAPYGMAWERFLRAGMVEIAEDLRREGIWTVADLVAVNPRAAFERFAGVLFGEFIVKVKEFDNGQQ